MATFYFATTSIDENGSYSATLQSAVDGEEYVVEYYRSKSGGTADGFLTLKWKTKSSRYLQVSIFDHSTHQKKFEKILFVTYALRATFSLINSKESLIAVSVATRVHLTKYEPFDAEVKIMKQLSTDMGNLFKSGKASDVILTDGSEEIRAHKLILSARSSVFSKMFLHPMKENCENRITISDVSIEALRELLHFMYSGTVVIKDSKMAHELYFAADKYDVKGLREICTTVLKSVDFDNVLDTLFLADLYSDEVLKKAALFFIANNYSQLKALHHWNSFMERNQALAIEILSFVLEKETTNLHQV